MGRNPKLLSRDELEQIAAPESARIEKRHHNKEAYIMSPKLKLAMIQVLRISDGIMLLEALGEGKLLVSTRVRDPAKGYYDMAKADIKELSGKSQQEIYDLLDRRTDAIEREKRRP